MSANSNSKRFNGYERRVDENCKTAEVVASFRMGQHVNSMVGVSACTANHTLTVFASDAFGALNARRDYPVVQGYGYWPVSFEMVTEKGTWTFSEWAMPEYYDGEAVTYVTKVAHPDGSETVWTMVVFND